MAGIRVVVEVGSKRAFASALDWPGWSRAGKTAELAVDALAKYAPRYAVVATQGGLTFPKRADDIQVIERLPGNATTDYGAPDAWAAVDWQPMTRAETDRMCTLVEAAWKTFDNVVKKAPAELRKGPRGGGRDRDEILDHVLGAEAGYGYKVGLRLRQPAAGDGAGIAALRQTWLDAFRAGADGKPLREGGWPTRYAARRIAWHVMDHAWEIEDRSS
jgi:hypothetical protein